MKQTNEAEELEAAKAEIGHYEKIAGLKEKYKELLTEDTIKHYSLKLCISPDEAVLRLCANFEKEESSVDAKAIALNAMKGIRILSPKVNGMEQRERSIESRLRLAERNLKSINMEIEEQKKVRERQMEALETSAKKLLELEREIQYKLSEINEKTELLEQSKKWTLSNILTIFRKKKKTPISES